MKQIQGRLKSFRVRTTQGEWTFDVSSFTGAGAAQPVARADAQPQPSSPPQQPGGHDANLAKNNSIPPSRIGQKSRTEATTVRDLPQSDDTEDDDAFMEPPPRQPTAKKQCINATHAKPANNPVNYAHAPTARCAPSIFNMFVDHLTLQQRRRIKAMGFDGLLCVSAERLESRELLRFLFNRLDPKTMVINITKEKSIRVTPFVVKQVLGLPDSGEVLYLHTHTQASKYFSAFKASLGLHESHDLHANHLQTILKDDLEWGSGMINNDMAISFFFIIASNKLLFPSTDNNIRCKDVYLTRDLSRLPAFNWCKAVVDDLREAALTWHTDKAKKSLSGCALLLIILYLDNLECQHQIGHADTPRVKYFNQSVIKKLISSDRSKDQQGKTTFGMLPFRDSIHTCYHATQHPFSNTPPSIDPLATTHLPTIQAQLRGLVDQIRGGHRKTQAMLALANFDAKAKQASNYLTIGQQMLRDAHQAAIRTLQAISKDQMLVNNIEDHDNHPHDCSAVPINDAELYAGHSAHNVSGGPFTRSAGIGNDLSYGETNIELTQGMPAGLQQNRTQHQDLPPSEDVHPYKEMEDDIPLVCTQILNQAADWVPHQNAPMTTDVQQGDNDLDNEMEGDRPLVCTQVDDNIDNEMEGDLPLVCTQGDEMEGDLPVDCTQPDKQVPAEEPQQKAPTVTDVQQGDDDLDNEMGDDLQLVCTQPDKQVPAEEPQQKALTVIAVQQLAGTGSTTDDALGPILLHPFTQEQTLVRQTTDARPHRLTKKPAMYVSPFKGDPQRARAPITKSHAVWKKFHSATKWESDIFIRNCVREFNGADIIYSFMDDEMLSTQFMSYLVACMSHDESHMDDGAGYRVFLSQELGEYINIEEDEDYSQWESHSALTVLLRDIGDIDPTKVKLFLLPVIEEEHYSVYCINFIHDRIDVLDSSPDDHTEYHQVLGDRIIRRLNLLFQLSTELDIKQFTRFKRPIINTCVQSHDHDCGFYAIKFMELWNGDRFHVPILTEHIRRYRSQLLFYALYHPLNEIKKLPAGLEAHRPRH